MNKLDRPSASIENLTYCRDLGAEAARDGIAIYDRSFSKKSHGKVLWLAACFDALATTQRGFIETGTMSMAGCAAWNEGYAEAMAEIIRKRFIFKVV